MTVAKVVITDCDLPGSVVEEILYAAGLHVERADCRTEQDVMDAAQGADAIIVQWAPITARVLAHLSSLRFISRVGIGYDMIDVDAATQRGVAVANTPEYCVEEVAAHTIALALALTRGVVSYDRAVRAGRWAPTEPEPMAARPSATTAAVIGYGRIGALAARHFSALGFHVLVHDPFVSDETLHADHVRAVDLDDALRRADVLSLHAPLTRQTRHLINTETIALMKPGAVVVNTCRGPLIEENALIEALTAGRLAGAALDVFEAEPLMADSPITKAPNLLLTPHAAWYSAQALADLPSHAASNVVRFLQSRPVDSIVNGAHAAPSSAVRGRR